MKLTICSKGNQTITDILSYEKWMHCHVGLDVSSIERLENTVCFVENHLKFEFRTLLKASTSSESTMQRLHLLVVKSLDCTTVK